MTGRSVAAGTARALFDYAVSRGASADTLEEQAGLRRGDLLDHDNRVPFAAYVALFRAAKQLCGDPALAIHFGEAVDPSEFSVVGLLTHASETMLDSLIQINRFGQLVAEMELSGDRRFVIEQEGDAHWLVDTRLDPNSFPEATETSFTRLICGPRRFLPAPHILEAQVTHPAPAYRAEYDRVWGVPVTFAAKRNAMRFIASLYTQRVQLLPRYAFGVLSAHADALMKELEQSRTMRGRVESLIMPILHRGEVSVDAIAERMGVSRQTVYRKLKAEGVTFEQVLDGLRHKLALTYLRSERVSVHEVAYLVGFSDPTAFSRAFRRWTGTTPRAVRLAGD